MSWCTCTCIQALSCPRCSAGAPRETRARETRARETRARETRARETRARETRARETRAAPRRCTQGAGTTRQKHGVPRGKHGVPVQSHGGPSRRPQLRGRYHGSGPVRPRRQSVAAPDERLTTAAQQRLTLLGRSASVGSSAAASQRSRRSLFP
jgi:hypothetical protein